MVPLPVFSTVLASEPHSQPNDPSCPLIHPWNDSEIGGDFLWTTVVCNKSRNKCDDNTANNLPNFIENFTCSRPRRLLGTDIPRPNSHVTSALRTDVPFSPISVGRPQIFPGRKRVAVELRRLVTFASVRAVLGVVVGSATAHFDRVTPCSLPRESSSRATWDGPSTGSSVLQSLGSDSSPRLSINRNYIDDVRNCIHQDLN